MEAETEINESNMVIRFFSSNIFSLRIIMILVKIRRYEVELILEIMFCILDTTGDGN